PAGGADFGAMLKNVMEQAVETSRTAETQMAAHVQGKAQLIDVVTAISAAETSLETVMAVRDQVISAYQEIMRMPI
ncbi:MAG: flagellar hook-basal body complex protein FliE, partial [Caulobacteraceae bacterium]|nr:flagellar hook-basal body complex protein FliE [Caulobacteraceae bacterium]